MKHESKGDDATTAFHRTEWIADELSRLESDGLRRILRTRDGTQGATIRYDGGTLVNFGSNDYLSLARDPRMTAALRDAVDQGECGAGASPLVSGHSAALEALEQEIAEFESAEAALVFPTGFAANLGTIPALVGAGDVIYSDANNHASLIDGCRLSRAQVHIYRHADVDHLARQMAEGVVDGRRLIVTDSLFSMDGDFAPLGRLVDLARKHDAMLMVDEAHATGVCGSHGRGVAERFGVEDEIDIRVGTLSKALGAAGGFICGSRELVDWLANTARTYVFSTALPAGVAAAARTAIGIVETEPQRRETLNERAADLRDRLRCQGFDLGNSESQIIPLSVGDAPAAVAMAEALQLAGYYVPAIRPPSVAEGTSRLRISLAYEHTTEMIDGLVDALLQCRSARVERASRAPVG